MVRNKLKKGLTAALDEVIEPDILEKIHIDLILHE